MSTLSPSPAPREIGATMRDVAEQIDGLFMEALRGPKDGSAALFEAMRYAAVGGGKRIRPLLVCAVADLFGVPRQQSLRAGLGVECIHVHSLIHDDLPCMDDDDLRRGRPTVHIIFDEATAVLAGDALLALAFEVLADGRTYADSSVRAQLVLELARAVGASGMAGGQMLDLYPDVDADLAAVTRLQRLKTGALVSWCVEAGAIMGGASADERTSLRGYAQSVGLAFQIADDLLDKSGDENKVGKRLRKDEAQGKATFLSLLGPERARLQAEALVGQAVDHLRGIDADTSLLADIARFAITRDR